MCSIPNGGIERRRAFGLTLRFERSTSSRGRRGANGEFAASEATLALMPPEALDRGLLFIQGGNRFFQERLTV